MFVSKEVFLNASVHHSHTWQAVLWPNGTSMLPMQLPLHHGVPSKTTGLAAIFFSVGRFL